MTRVARYQAELAASVLPSARDAGDEVVTTACIEVREAWRLGRRVDPALLMIVGTFAGPSF